MERHSNSETLNMQYINSFINALQAKLPRGFTVSYATMAGDHFSRPMILIKTRNNIINRATPLFQIDKNYNLYNIPDRNAMDEIQRNSNGANIRNMLEEPESNATRGAWNAIMNHFYNTVDVNRLYEQLRVENTDITYRLEEGMAYPYIGGKKIT